MALRLLEILVPQSSLDEVREMLAAEEECLETWQEPVMDERMLVRVLVDAADTEAVLDRMEKRFSHLENFRALILAVAATIPRPAEPEPAPEPRPDRISREELLDSLAGGTRITRVFLLTVTLSAIVAAIGLLRDNVAVIIGAMVIAPLLTPNMALALSTTLGDVDLGRRAMRTNLAGMGLALVCAIVMGMILPPDATAHEYVSRTSASFGDTALALASGTAGALAFTSGVSAGLVGVMVAVALLPPLVVAGLSIGVGAFGEAGGALLLLATNIICVNLAAVVTFLLQGVRPRTWWESEKARRATRRAVVAWTALLALLVALVALAQS